nr:N-acetylneuraminate synthase [uncultured Anaeromusa sp.]
MKTVYVIAEAGVNHNGSIDMALQLVDEAANAGADAVKFQSFKAELLATTDIDKAKYQQRATGTNESQIEMLKRLELDETMHEMIVKRCDEKKIDFLSTPFDSYSFQYLINNYSMERIKVSSGDLTNGPLLLEIARAGKLAILSTGMATLGEIEDALMIMAYGYLNPEGTPDKEELLSSFISEKGLELLRKNVCLLHCTTDYPTPWSEVNLLAMETLRQVFSLSVGYSDHTEGLVASIGAVALGAEIIEKHFTLDRDLPGPDHKASLEPKQLKELITSIRQIEKALGGKQKKPSVSELENRNVVRKSLVASGRINKGEILGEHNISIKRAGQGISPMQYWKITNGSYNAKRSYVKDEPIEW